MSNDGILNADGSPESIHSPGVRRLNAVPLVLAGGILLVAAGLVIWVAIQKGKEQAPRDSTDHGGSATEFAQVVGSHEGYISYIKPLVVATPTPGTTSAPVGQVQPDTSELDARRKAFYASLFSQTSVIDRSLAQAQPPSMPVSAAETEKAIKADPNNLGGSTAEDIGQYEHNASVPPDPNKLQTYAGNKDRWQLNTRPEPPISAYVIQTGSVIPALLLTGMESELPGTIVAQVSQDVYDSPTGNYLMIPQGSRLIGEYSNMIQYGQARILIAWQRIVFPNGWTMDIGAQPGVDGQGEAGFRDQVDNHFIRLFGSAILMSAITGGIALSQNQGQGYGAYQAPNAGSVLSAALGQQLGNATSALLERNLSIPPTLKIRQGFRFNVIAIKDLVFDRPYVVPNY